MFDAFPKSLQFLRACAFVDIIELGKLHVRTRILKDEKRVGTSTRCEGKKHYIQIRGCIANAVNTN